MSDSQFVILNIGRNVSDRPMSISRWDQFDDEIERLLHIWADRYVGKGSGESEWGGIVEQFITYHAEIPAALLPAFRSDVAVVAAAFDQESIAVVVSGEGALVPAWNDVLYDDGFDNDPWSDAPVCPLCEDTEEWCPDFPADQEDWSHPGRTHDRGDR